MNKLGTIEKPDIFRYEDYRIYLRDMYQYLKSSHPGFSHRVFARLAGIKSYNYLKLVMDGQRNLSSKMIPAFVKGFKLNKQEAEFFGHTVALSQAQNVQSKSEILQKLLRVKKFREVKEIDLDQYEYFSKWYYAAVRELMNLSEFRQDPAWISQKLGGLISEAQVVDALKRLERLGLVGRNTDGELVITEANIASAPEIQSAALFSFHEEMIQKALNALRTLGPEARDVSSVTLALSEADLRVVKKSILQFRRKILTQFDGKRPSGSEVFQMNFQIFPLSQGKAK